jgi:hypothetical protein
LAERKKREEGTMSYNTSQRSDISVGDGFRFGCGFMIAAAVAYLLLAIVFIVTSVVFSGAIAAYLQRIR